MSLRPTLYNGCRIYYNHSKLAFRVYRRVGDKIDKIESVMHPHGASTFNASFRSDYRVNVLRMIYAIVDCHSVSSNVRVPTALVLSFDNSYTMIESRHIGVI